MILDLAYYGDPILRAKAAHIEHFATEELQKLILNMMETMGEQRGIGIAAPQVKHSIRLFLVNMKYVQQAETEQIEEEEPISLDDIQVFINPTIQSISESTDFDREGCLSIPGIYGEVERPINITVHAYNEKGESFTVECSDLFARVIMHENDHLNGVLFIDRLSVKEKNKIDQKLKKLKKSNKYG